MRNNNKNFSTSFFSSFFSSNNKFIKTLKFILVLYFPSMLITLFMAIFRRYDLLNVDSLFLYVCMCASIWFIVGPLLVYKYFNFLNNFLVDKSFKLEFKLYLKNKYCKLYKTYKFFLIIFSFMMIFWGLGNIVIHPNVLTDYLTYGYNDILFWIIILFLAWLLIYASNAFSIIVTIFLFIYDIIKKDIIKFIPTSKNDSLIVSQLIKLSNRAVAYTCSGVLFIPLALYFIFRNHYTFWVIILLFIYSFFLIFSITIPQIMLKKYVKNKNKEYINNEKYKYFNELKVARTKSFNNIKMNIYFINRYFYIQELDSTCGLYKTFDINTLVTYLSVFATLVSTIPGFIQIAL